MDENTNNDFNSVAQLLAIDYEKIKSSQESTEQSFQESYKRLKLHNLVEFESSSDDVIHCDKLLNTIVDCYSEDKSLKESLLVEIITIRKYLIDLQNNDNRKYPSIESFVTDIETDNRKGINSGSLSNALVDARDLIANIKLNKIRASQIVGNAGNREIAVKWIESKLIELETPLKFSLLLVLENAKLYNNTLRTIIESGIDNTYISDEKLRIEFHKNELNKRIEHDVQEKLYKESLEKRNFALGNEIKGKRKFTRTFVIQNTSWQRINELAEFNNVESAYEYLLKICQLDTGVKANNVLLRDQTEVRKSISNGGQWSYLKLIPKKEYTQVEVSIDLDGSHSAMKTESNVVDINSAKQKTDSELVSGQYKSYEEYIIQNFGQLPKGVIEQIEMDERLNDGEDDLLLELANRLKEERVKSSATESDQSSSTQNLDLFSGVSTTVNGISIPENNDQEITPDFYQEILESENLTLKYQDALDSIFNSRLVEIRNEMAKRGWRPNDVGPGMNKDISTSTSQATYTMTFSFEKKGAGGNVVKMSAMLGGSKIINDDLKKTPYELAFDITSSITNVMVNGNMTLTYDSSYLGVFTGRVDLSGTTAMHEVLMLEGHEANQKKLVYSSPNENLLVTEQDYDRARELIKNHPELSRNFSIAAANALQNAYGDKGLPEGYISRNTLSGIEGNFIDAEWFIEKLTDLTESLEASDKIKEKASILLSMLNESRGAPHIYSYKIVPEDNGFRLHSLHRNLDQLGLWGFSEDDLKKKLKSAISIFDTSDFFKKRWTSVRGTVTDVRLHSLATNGVGSELYSVHYDSGAEIRFRASEFLQRIEKEEFDATPEGIQAAIDREAAYTARVAQSQLDAENARLKKLAHTNKLEKWLQETNYSDLGKGKAISVLEKSFLYAEFNENLTRAEFIERKVESGAKLTITVENKVKDKSRLEWFRMDNEQQRAHEDKVANGGTKEIYWIGNYDVTKTEYEYAQYVFKSINKSNDYDSNIIVEGEEVVKYFKTLASMEAQEPDQSIIDQIKDNNYNVKSILIADLLNSDVNLNAAIGDMFSSSEFTNDELYKPIILNEVQEVIDGYHRIEKLIQNAETHVWAYVPTNLKITKEVAGNLTHGDVVKDKNGNKYLALGARHEWLEVAPIVDGKAVVNSDSTFKFHLNTESADSYDGRRRSDPIFTTKFNLYKDDQKKLNLSEETDGKFEKNTFDILKTKHSWTAFSSSEMSKTFNNQRYSCAFETYTGKQRYLEVYDGNGTEVISVDVRNFNYDPESIADEIEKEFKVMTNAMTGIDKEKNIPDVSYRDDGMFTSFFPNTPSGETIFREMSEETNGTGKVLSVHAESVIDQMKSAGYSVEKMSPDDNEISNDELYSVLLDDAHNDSELAQLEEIDLASLIMVAADSVEKLRQIDVYRVLDSAANIKNGVHVLALADYIKSNRSDLVEEVDMVLAEIGKNKETTQLLQVQESSAAFISQEAARVTLKNGNTVGLSIEPSPNAFSPLVRIEYGEPVSIVAKSNTGAEIGRLTYMPNGGPIDAFVSEGHRRNGVATALYNELEKLGGTIPAANSGFALTKDAEAFRANRNAPASTPALPYENVKTRFSSKSYDEVNHSWLVMNAARPLLGNQHFQGDFLSGRFYVGLDPADEFTNDRIDQNIKLDASFVLFATKEEQILIGLNRSEYKDEYLDLIIKGGNERELNPLIEDIRDLPYKEAVESLKVAKIQLNGKSLLEFARESKFQVETGELIEKVSRSGDVRNMNFAIEKQGRIILSGSIPREMDIDSEQANISYYINLTKGTGSKLYLGRSQFSTEAFPLYTNDLIFGKTFQQIQDMQQGKNIPDAISSVMPIDAVLVFDDSASANENNEVKADPRSVATFADYARKKVGAVTDLSKILGDGDRVNAWLNLVAGETLVDVNGVNRGQVLICPSIETDSVTLRETNGNRVQLSLQDALLVDVPSHEDNSANRYQDNFSHKMTISDIGMGLIAAQNNSIALIGGYRSGSSDGNTTRLKYSIQDVAAYDQFKDSGISQEQLEKLSTVGIVELFVKSGSKFDVAGLVNIEINTDQRKKGYAKKVIAAILETCEGDLKIHDIKRHYVSVWRKLGVTSFVNIFGQPMVISKAPKNQTINGVINYDEFKKAALLTDGSTSIKKADENQYDLKVVPQRAGYFPNRYYSFNPSGYTEINELGDLTGLKKESINTIMGGRQAIVTSWSDDNGNGFEVREFQLKEGEELPETESESVNPKPNSVALSVDDVKFSKENLAAKEIAKVLVSQYGWDDDFKGYARTEEYIIGSATDSTNGSYVGLWTRKGMELVYIDKISRDEAKEFDPVARAATFNDVAQGVSESIKADSDSANAEDVKSELSTYRILDEKHGKLEITKIGELDFENVYDATKSLTKLQLNKRGYLEDIYNWLGGSMFPAYAIKGEIVPVDKIRQKLTWVSGADVLKVKRLESANEMSLREPLIIEALIASGKLEKLLSFAGTKSYGRFSDLPSSEKVAAYFKYLDSGEQPIEFTETYNQYAERLEKEALHRRLSSTNQIVQTNGKPFKTEKSAGTFLTEQNLVETHRVEPVEDGFVVVMMPLAYQAEAKRIAEGRESYIDAQESVLRFLGYETNDQGEYEIADREWEQVDRLTESRLNRNAPENTVEKLLSEFNDVGFGLTLRIVDKGLWFVIAKEPYEQGKYRWQSFDETGFIIHKTFDSPEQAIEHAYALGASVIAPFETLDGLAASEEWANSLVSPRQESNVEVDKKLSNGAEDYVDQLQISDTNQEMVQSQIAQTHFDLVLERAAIGRLVNKEKGIVTFIDPDNGIETVDLRQYRQNVFSYEEKIGIQAWVDFSTKKELLAAYEQLVERRKSTHLDSEKNEMLELSNEDKDLRTVEIRKVLLPYMTAVGFYSSLSGPNLASVRAQALGVLHNEPKYPLSKSGINALIDDLAIFAGIDLDNTAAGKDSDLSDWIKGAHKTVKEINSNEIQAEVSILAEHDTEREKLAHRYMEIMKNYYTGHSKINDMHYKVADGILNKDAYAIEHIANGMNKALVSFFQEVTGIKLPKTQGGIWDEVLKWAGISKEFDTLRTAKRNYNREKEILLKKFNNGNEVVQMFENHIENGFVELKKIARQMHLYNPKTNQGYNLSSKGTNLAKTQDYVAARLEVYKAELNISFSSKSEANISLIDKELTYKKVGDSWMPDFSHLSRLEGDDLLPHINKLTEDNLHAEAAMLRAMRLKDTSLFERALAYQQHTFKNKCILPEYSTEVSKLHELLSTAEHNLENKLNTCEKSVHIESIPAKEEIPYMHSMEDGKNIKFYSYTTGVQLKNSDEFVGICTGVDTNSFWYIGREFGERTYNRLNAVSITDAYAEAKLKKLSPEYSLESEALQDQITNADYQRLDDRHLNNDDSPSTASEYLGFTCYHELADDEWLPHEFYEYKNLLAGYDCLRKFGTPASGFQIVIGRENSDVKSAHSLGECLIVTIDGEFVKSFGGNHQNANETIFELLESDLWASHISKVNLNSAQSKVVLDLIAEGKTFKFTKNSQFFKDVAILNYEENEFKLLDGNGVTHNIEGGNVYKVKELLDSLDLKKEIHWAEASSSSDIALYSLLEKQNHQEFAMN